MYEQKSLRLIAMRILIMLMELSVVHTCVFLYYSYCKFKSLGKYDSCMQ